jgi:hypothetical protein
MTNYAKIRAAREDRTDFMWERCSRGVPPFDVLIYPARYGGIYEGAQWLAWMGEIEWLDEHQGCDVECPSFYADYRHAPIGRGPTPDEALADLDRIAALGRKAYEAEREEIRRLLEEAEK